MLWMDRALFGDEPLIVLKLQYLLLGFQLRILLSLEVLHRGCLFKYYWGNPLANVSEVVGNPQANLYRGSEGIGNPLSNFYRVSEGIGNPLTNSSECIGNFCKQVIFVRGLPKLSDPLPEVIELLRDICKRVSPITETEATFLQYI